MAIDLAPQTGHLGRDIVTVPSNRAGQPALEYDLTEVNSAIVRMEEIAHVNPGTAPELLKTFNVAYLHAEQVVAGLEKDVAFAQREVDRIYSIVLLDRVPEILKSKGLTSSKNPLGSEDLRKAVIDSDHEYTRASEILDMTKAVLRLMKSKSKSIEMSYNSVKKILGESNAHNYGGAYEGTRGGESSMGSAGQTSYSNGFGKAKI